MIRRFREAFGKSTGAQSLYDHVMSSCEVAILILDKFAKGFPKEKMDALVFASFVHDIGKLDPDFQAMLKAVISDEPLPSKRIKHEASTLEYADLLKDSAKEASKEICAALGYEITEPIDIEISLAFAVSHHGLFYMAYEATQAYGERWLIRREWTNTPTREIKRITLVDLLFKFHPFGGLVMVSDLISSYCHEKKIDYKRVISRTGLYRELISGLIEEARDLERVLDQDDPRADRGLEAILSLLLGGVK